VSARSVITALLDAGGDDADAVLHVHVQPRAGKDEIRGRHGDALRVRVTAPPVDGRATAAVAVVLGAAFGVAPSRVELVSGDRSRLKRFRLAGLSRGEAIGRLTVLLGDDPSTERSLHRRRARTSKIRLPLRRPTWGGGAEGIMAKATRGTSAAPAASKSVRSAKAGATSGTAKTVGAAASKKTATARPVKATKVAKPAKPAKKATTAKVTAATKAAKNAKATKPAKRAPAEKAKAPAPAKAAKKPEAKAKPLTATKTAPAKAAPPKTTPAKSAPVKATAKAAPAAKTAAKAPAAEKAVAKAAATKTAAKAAPVPAAPKPPPVKKAPPLAASTLEKLKAHLEEERARHLAQAEVLAAEAEALATEREQGDTQFDEESGEGDTVSVERERDLALSASARQTVDEIERALARIADGTYGSCVTCGDRIPVARLEVIPWADQCVKCKSRGERRR
jgi:uncharacterized protein (TIGR00251 family)